MFKNLNVANLRLNLVTALLLLGLAIVVIFPATPVAAEEIADGGSLTMDIKTIQGTINFVHQESFELIVEDRSFILNRTLRFKNAIWSRERAIQVLEKGHFVKLDLGGKDENDTSARLVEGITVIRR